VTKLYKYELQISEAPDSQIMSVRRKFRHHQTQKKGKNSMEIKEN